jgi:HEAT repeat protein
MTSNDINAIGNSLLGDDDMPNLADALKEMESLDDDLPSDTVTYGLSDADEDDRDAIYQVWQQQNVTYRRVLLQALIEITSSEFQYNYRIMGLIALEDDDSMVRQLGAELIADVDAISIMHKLIDQTQHDTALPVQIEAVRALGNFIRKGELDELPLEKTLPARERMVAILEDSTQIAELQNVALEAIAHCSDERLTGWIQRAYQSGDTDARRSAIIAMGNSCDERWNDYILEELQSDDFDIRLVAARSAGALEIADAVTHLESLIADTSREAQIVAVQSLAEIGGARAMHLLEKAMQIAEEMDDADMIERIDEAMSEAEFMSGQSMFDDVPWDDED